MNNRGFSEDSRVKIPAIVHLTRLGYQYISTKKIRKQDNRIDLATNIYIDSFLKALNQLNGRVLNGKLLMEDDALQLIHMIADLLEGEDLGRKFYQKLQQGISYNDQALKLLDFENPQNNIFEVATEMPCGTEEESFRPDITLYINGLPLAFIEAKIPDNLKGMQAEYERMIKRSTNPKFRAYINETQLMVFSNNMEYNETEQIPISGAFYATAAYGQLFFSHFREEDESIYSKVQPIDSAIQKAVLKDTNMSSILLTPEYQTNQQPDTPTNRILTSLFLPERFLFLLHYGFNYVERTNVQGVRHIEKHVMRYQQFFATKAILKCVDNLQPAYKDEIVQGHEMNYVQDETEPQAAEKSEPEKRKARGGVIWHTQGSGKTELAYYNVHVLTDYFARKRISAKFYFIVDRIDLMTQAADEFRSRGLNVVEISSRENFIKNIQSVSEMTSKGGRVMNVVNIQRFSDEAVTVDPDYNVNVQRIYFIDEAHRDFKAAGEYLARLVKSDTNAIKFALTGTPLIGKIKTKDLFGDYIHKYYYNMSIKDGYTLPLIREGIKTEYRLKLKNAQAELEQEVRKGSIQKKEITCQPQYVEPMVEFIEEDFSGFRLLTKSMTAKANAAPVGGMIVCDSSEQAEAVQKQLEQDKKFSSALVLHKIGDSNDELKDKRDSFKKGKTDFLVVFKMLLTGFDAPRLKKMYLGRKIKEHNLLQALTRVNRPYKGLRYGYVVDFADIREEFDKTNKAYLEELKDELGNSYEQYSSIFKSQEEIQKELQEIQDKLFSYDTDNLENFQQQINSIEEKQDLLELRHVLQLYKELHGLSELFGYKEILEQLDTKRINKLAQMVDNRISIINDILASQDTTDMETLIQTGDVDLQITFKKIGKSELALADGYYQKRNQTLSEFNKNQDPKDPEYVKLLDELKRVLENHNMSEMTLEEMQAQDKKLDVLRKKMHQLNEFNSRWIAKYHDDPRYMRLHKRFTGSTLFPTDSKLFPLLDSLKNTVDESILVNSHDLMNPAYFQQNVAKQIHKVLMTSHLQASIPDMLAFTQQLSQAIVAEYLQ